MTDPTVQFQSWMHLPWCVAVTWDLEWRLTSFTVALNIYTGTPHTYTYTRYRYICTVVLNIYTGTPHTYSYNKYKYIHTLALNI